MIDCRKSQVQNRANEVIAWRDYLTTMSDKRFFNLIHIYLGEVKTPYNKQKLIEDLSSFLRKEDHKKTIPSLLSQNDIKILTAIYFLPNPTRKKLSELFAGDFSSYRIHDALLNFEERLLIFTVRINEKKDGEVYKINPLLSDTLKPFFALKNLFNFDETDETASNEYSAVSSFQISPMFIAAMYSFVKTYDSLLKNDGSFKKKIEESMQDFFPSIAPDNNSIITRFLQAGKNLSLFIQNDNELFLNRDRWLQFASLPFACQAIHLAVACEQRLTNSAQARYAQQLLSLISTARLFRSSEFEKPLGNENLKKLAYIIDEKMNAQNETALQPFASRLSKIIASENSSIDGDEKDNSASNLFERIIDHANLFGLFSLDFDSRMNCIEEKTDLKKDDMPHVRLTLDANFSVVVLDFDSLSALLPVLDLCEFKSFDSVMQLEITKKSCMKAFDLGFSGEEIKELLAACTIHPLPQNLLFSIDEWFCLHQSSKVYYGFVLQLEERKRVAFEHSTEFASHIKTILAPGIYLLDFENAEAFNECVEKAEKSGLDFINYVPKKTCCQPLMPLKRVENLAELNFSSAEIDMQENPENFAEDSKLHISKMKEKLSEIDATKEQDLVLSERILRKTIIDCEQLRTESVRFEKTEAFGMDYAGKIYVIENAIASNSLVEICYGSSVFADAKNNENGMQSFVVLPLSLERTATETYLTSYFSSPNNEQKEITLPVGTSISVKRLAQKGWDS